MRDLSAPRPPPSLARLALSREVLRKSLQSQPSNFEFLSAVKARPSVAIFLDVLRALWPHKSMNGGSTPLVDSIKASLAPLAQRNPLGLVGVALATGAVLMWLRPWRWGIVKPALLAGLGRQLLEKVVSGASLEAWLAAITQGMVGEASPGPEPATAKGPTHQARP